LRGNESMSDTPRSSGPGASQARRAVLKLALGVGLGLPVADLVGAQGGDPRKARPQANDRFVFAGGERKGQVITLRAISRSSISRTARGS